MANFLVSVTTFMWRTVKKQGDDKKCESLISPTFGYRGSIQRDPDL